jgi:hypothetical protein
MARIAANIKQDPQFKALVAALGSEEKAKVAYDRLHPAVPEVDPRIQSLLDAGFTEEQAAKALEEQSPEAPAEPAKLAPVTPLSSKERAEALVSDKGFEYTKGRVYGGPSLAEAIVRVHKTGKPEIVASSGVGRTKGVLVYKEDSGDVALQNLTKA